MAAPVVLGITIRSDGSAQVNRDLQSVRRNLNDTGNAAQSSNRQFAAMASQLKTMFAVGSIAAMAKEVFGVNREFQSLRASLSSAVGGIENAKTAFAFIQDFAAKTPYDVAQVTESFIKLKNFGLNPSEEALRSYGNTASSQSKPLMQMIEAVADAATGEFERLKEFGIKSAQQGDQVIFTFRGVETAVKNSSETIQAYLQKIGQTEFAGAMERQAKTIEGAVSNFGDSWSRTLDDLISTSGEEEIAAVISTLANNLSTAAAAAITLGEIAVTVFAGKMVTSLTAYASAKYIAITTERAHAAAIVMNLERTVALTAAELANTTAITASVQATLVSTTSMGARMAVANQLNVALLAQSQASASAAAATDALALSTGAASLTMKTLFSAASMVNVALAALVGWEVGSFLNKFESVRRVANDVLYSILTGVENVTYYWSRLTAVMSGNSAQLDGLKAAHVAQQAIIGDLISDTNTYVSGSGMVSAALDQQSLSLNSLSGQTSKAAGKLSDAAKEAEKLQDQYDKLTLSTEDYNKKHAQGLSGSPEEITEVERLSNAISTLEDSKKSLTESTKDQESAAKSLQTAYENAVSAMEKESSLHSSGSSKSAAMEYEVTAGALSKLTEAQKLKLLQDAAAIDNQAIAKKTSDAYKSELDGLIDKYNQLTLSARDYYEQKLKSQGLTAEQVKPVMAQFDKNTAFEAQQKGIEAARDRMSDYDKIIQQVNASTSKLGATNEAVFDGALGGINTLVGVFQNMGEALKDTTHQQELLNKAYAKEKDDINNHSGLNERQKFTLMLGKEADYLKANHKLEREKTNDALTGTRQMIGATAKMFDEKSSAAKALHSLETGIAVAQMAMQGVQMVKDLAATGVSMAAGAAKMFSQSGWGGFVGVAAMGAVMAGLGYSAFGGGGGSEPSPTYSPDTGTVLGDSTAKSESIDKTYQLLKDIHADEYAELRGINRGIASLSTGITDVITRLFQAGGVKDFATLPTGKMTGISGMLTSIDPINKAGFDPIGKAVLGFLFGGKQTSTVTAQGISTGATSISDIMNGGNLSANQFATIETKTKGGLLGKDKVRYSEQYAALDAATQDSLNKVFGSMGRTMLGLAESIGHDTKQRVEDYIIPAMRVDLKGLNGEDAAKKLNGVISAALDSMSTSVFGDIIGQYQKLGEGMLETAVRIVSEVAVVKDALGKSGLSIAGDAIAISDALVQAAGGLQEFQKAFDDYYQKFYTESERNVFLQKNLVSQLEDLNAALPATREGYRKLVESLDVNNAADAQRYSLLIKLSGAADDYYKVLESASESALQIAQQRRALDIQLMELSGNAIVALTEKRRDELAAMDESLRFSQQAIWALSSANKAVDDAMNVLKKSVADQKAINNAAYQATISANNLQKQAANDLLSALKTVAGNIKAALGATVIESDAFSKQRRQSAMGVLQSALSYSDAGGSLSNFSGLDQALVDIAKPSEQLYSSFIDFARDQGRASNVLSGLADNTNVQISVAEQTLKAVEDSTTALTDGFSAENARLDALVTTAQSQIDAINGTTAVVMSVNDAVINMTAAMNAKLATSNAIAAAQYADKAEMAAKTNYQAAAAQAAQSAKILNYVAGAAQDYSAQAQAARALSTAPIAAAPSTWQSGQSGNAVWEQVLSWFNAEHMKRYGITMNRPWSADGDAQRQYSELVVMYNSMSASAAQAAAAQAAGLENLANATAALIPGYQQTASVDQTAAAQAAASYATAKAYTAAAHAAVPGINSFEVGTNYVTEERWAKIHPGERIMPAADNKELMMRLSEPGRSDNSDLIAEFRRLRDEVNLLRSDVRIGQATIAGNTRDTGRMLEKWDIDGMPAERT